MALKVTKQFLKLYGFEYEEKSKLWIKRYSAKGAYLWYRLTYDFSTKKLTVFAHDCVGFTEHCYEIEDVYKIREKIIHSMV